LLVFVGWTVGYVTTLYQLQTPFRIELYDMVKSFGEIERTLKETVSVHSKVLRRY